MPAYKFPNGVDLQGRKGANAAPGTEPTDLATVSQVGLPTYIQQANPNMTSKGQWWETNPDGTLKSLWIETGP